MKMLVTLFLASQPTPGNGNAMHQRENTHLISPEGALHMVVFACDAIWIAIVGCEAAALDPCEPCHFADGVPLRLVQLQTCDNERCKQICVFSRLV